MKHPFARLAFVVVLSAGLHAAGGQAPSGQVPTPPPQPASEQPPVTFRAEVNYVEVDARVVDAQGNFVTDLSEADFEVLEDGKPQPVRVFSLVNIPVDKLERPLFASQPIEPDVTTNTTGYSGRLYLIVLDDLHTHPLRALRVKAAAKQFVQRNMGATDVAAIVHTSGRSDAGQEFTSNQRLLVNAIDKFSGRKLRSSLLGRLEAEQMSRGMRAAGERIDDPDAAERGYQARSTLESLRGFAEFLSGVRGRRKALVYFSEGIDYDITDPFNNRDATTIMDTTRDVIAAATRANVAIYGVDVRGLGAGLDDGIEIQSFPDDPTLGLDSSALANETRLGQDSLRVLSEETGGFAAVNTNDIAGAFRRLVEENSSYYVLGYYPTNDRRDGRFRRIDVRVKRPGLTVRARRGYVAPRGRATETKLAGPSDASPELREAISSPVPVSGLPLAATASVFKGPDNTGSIVVSALIGGRDLPVTEKDGTYQNDIELTFLAIDAKGKIFPADRSTLTLNLKPDTLARVRTAGFRIINAVDVPPGRYQLRIAAREGIGRRAGSVVYDIDVPDFAKERLSMSSLALTSMSSGVAPTVRPKDPLQTLLPAPLTSYREFAQGDEIAVFAEVYETAGQPSHKVAISATMKAEGGQAVFETREERDSAELKGSSGGYGFSTRIPTGRIAPGLYVLRVEAQARVTDGTSVSRETIVRIFPAPAGAPAAGAAPPPRPPVTTPDAGAAAPPPARAESPAPPAAPAPPSAATRAPVPFTTLNNDQMSGVDEAEQRVARTAAEFEALWKRHAPGRPAPTVNFTTTTVLAVFLGSRPSGGYDVAVTDVQSDGNTLVVRWAEKRPAPGQMAVQVLTSPAHFVTVRRHPGEVRFEKVEP